MATPAIPTTTPFLTTFFQAKGWPFCSSTFSTNDGLPAGASPSLTVFPTCPGCRRTRGSCASCAHRHTNLRRAPSDRSWPDPFPREQMLDVLAAAKPQEAEPPPDRRQVGREQALDEDCRRGVALADPRCREPQN